MSDILFVRIFDRYADVLERAGIHCAPEDWRFEYDPSYVQGGQATALSVSLPLRDEMFAGPVVCHWFGNLLPEGAIKAAICHCHPDRQCRCACQEHQPC
ncbi:HipA N-terminal domain-containing protein [Frateuria aurantia]|uniref:HipA domain-containing protein n=1 Tax=Frateuria aurantia (strain ATCC 33424 / DSM 6220 / KCTC 2777 / LMG 1558 / NBRC 3245 / NCIMB 13370) TaxID=767434 RepID=H8L5B6_FRAAD|nr:HipA N-terminal domain-containing protein [Frateuria aurantia]AFC85073.1 HipA domain-containing protein [Frateuria aurantia DSM 6220]